MLEAGLLVSINSDDPAFFGTLDENYHAVFDHLEMNKQQIITCVRNSFASAFMPDEKKAKYINALNTFIDQQKI